MKREKDSEISDKTLRSIEANKELMPTMNVGLPIVSEPEDLIEDEKILGVYEEVLNNIRQDRVEINDLLSKFIEMVINDGDATTSSKEAVVNLLKIKTDTADKMSKIADLMTRIKLKETNTFPRYLAAHQNNTINIGKKTLTPMEKRTLIENESKKLSEKQL